LSNPLVHANLNIENPSLERQPESTINVDINLPYYPFKNEQTRSADSLFLHYRDQEALEKYKEASRYFKKLKNWEGVGYANNMMAEIYTNRLYDYESAERQLRLSESLIKNTLGEDHPLIGDTYLTYGSYNGRLSRTPQEQEYLEASLKLRLNYYGLQSIQVAEVNYRLGQMFQHEMGEPEKAKEHYHMALIVFKEHLPSNHPDLIKAYYALGSVYRKLKDYLRAIIHLDQAIYMYSLDSISNVSGIARSLNIKANVLNEKRDFELSNIIYESAIKLYEEIYGPDNFDLIFAYLGLAVGYLRTGDYESVINYLDQSLEIYNIYYSIDNPIDLYPYILLNKGECFSKLRQKDSATFFLFKGLNLRRTYFSEDRGLISYAYRAIADMYNDFDLYDSAMHYSQKALIELAPDFNNMKYDQNPDINQSEYLTEFIDAFALKAKILKNMFLINPDDLNLLNHSLGLYRKLDHLTDDIKNSEYTQESKLILINDIHQIYGDAIQCASELYQITKEDKYLDDVLNFFEKNKYMLLFQNMELARKSNELNLPFEYQFKEDSLQMLLAEITQSIEDEDPQAVSKLSSDRYEIDNALTALREEIEINYPNFYEMEYDELTVRLFQLKKYSADNNTLLIEYFAGDSAISIIAIGPTNVTLHQIHRTSTLNIEIDGFLNSISNVQQSDSIQAYYNRFKNSAYYIYKNILLPVIEQHDQESYNQVIIAPDGILAQVPFEALIKVLPESDYPDYSNLEYLIHSCNISYVYSFNLFLKDLDREFNNQNNILAFSYSGIRVLKNPEKRSEDIIELPGTRQEIESIKKIIKGKNLFLEDEDATETLFKLKSKDYQILHLAVHGIADDESAINSRLVFKNQEDSLNDGYLFLYEVYNVDLNQSKLAILSACETGIGKEFKGEGVFSIARGFAHAGCPSIIMSLWKVNDMVSAEIMARFYKNLKKGRKINASLRASKIDYIIRGTGQLLYH
jgi:CHAT domain-containing protein/tetratricopeptide (TPR) repeat protein